MTTLVVDASAFVEYLLRTPENARVEATLLDPGAELNVPALCDVEVTAAFRRALLLNKVTHKRVAEALEDYLDLPLVRHGHQGLLTRTLQLRANFTVYDATYVALAELLGATLVTADARLRRAVARATSVELGDAG